MKAASNQQQWERSRDYSAAGVYNTITGVGVSDVVTESPFTGLESSAVFFTLLIYVSVVFVIAAEHFYNKNTEHGTRPKIKGREIIGPKEIQIKYKI